MNKVWIVEAKTMPHSEWEPFSGTDSQKCLHMLRKAAREAANKMQDGYMYNKPGCMVVRYRAVKYIPESVHLATIKELKVRYEELYEEYEVLKAERDMHKAQICIRLAKGVTDGRCPEQG